MNPYSTDYSSIMEVYGEVSETAGKKISSMRRIIESVKETIGDLFLPVLNSMLDTLLCTHTNHTHFVSLPLGSCEIVHLGSSKWTCLYCGSVHRDEHCSCSQCGAHRSDNGPIAMPYRRGRAIVTYAEE